MSVIPLFKQFDMAYVTLMGKWRTRLSLTISTINNVECEVANCIRTCNCLLSLWGLGMQEGVNDMGSYRGLHFTLGSTQLQ
eukprot:1183839-Prorocentrum_minimum.AAC.3